MGRCLVGALVILFIVGALVGITALVVYLRNGQGIFSLLKDTNSSIAAKNVDLEELKADSSLAATNENQEASLLFEVIGRTGPPGFKGKRGPRGESFRGRRGENAPAGDDVIGGPGVQGPPGHPADSVEAWCSRKVRYVAGYPGPPGERGDPGLKEEGIEPAAGGLNGVQGPKGYPAHPNIAQTGPPGPPGPPGEDQVCRTLHQRDCMDVSFAPRGRPGPPGQKGERGEPADNVIGLTEDQIERQRGPRGDPGTGSWRSHREAQALGPQGPPGPPGKCIEG